MSFVVPVIRLFLPFLILLSLQTGTAAGSSDKTPERIVSLTLGTDEILLSLVDPKRILAVTDLAADPGISNVSGLARQVPNKIKQVGVEPIIALQPELILAASYTSNDVVKQLEEAGLHLVRLDLFSSIVGIKENIRSIAQAVGARKKGEALIIKMAQQLQGIQAKVSNAEVRPGVLPYSPEGWTAGRDTIFDEMVKLAGGKNLAAEAGITGHQKISLEVVIQADPEIILLSAWQPDTDHFDQKLLRHPVLQNVSAIRENRVYALPERYLTTVSHFIAEGVEAMAKLFHPGLFTQTDSKR